MLIRVIVSCVIYCALLVLGMKGPMKFGRGNWSILDVQQCEGDAQMPWRLRVSRTESNRTLDAFDVDATTLAALDDSYGIRVNTCRMMKDGCKYFFDTSFDCAPMVIKAFARDYVERALSAAGVEPPDFPIPAGDYHLENFGVNTEDFSPVGLYGVFGSQSYLVKDGLDIACLYVSVKFQPYEDEQMAS